MADKALHRRTKSRTRNSSPNKPTDQPNWSELPADLLELIMKSLTAVDIIRCKAVCTSWLYALKYYPLPQPPWLMLPSIQQNDVNSRSFFDIANESGTTYTMTDLFRGFSDSWCIGSSHGWLVILDKKSVVHLFNPLSGGKSIKLPELGTIAGIPMSFNFDDHILHSLCGHIRKAVLSSDPYHNNNFMAAIIYNDQESRLAYCKKGYTTWIELYNDHGEPYSDALFHDDNQLFALVCDGSAIDLWNLKENHAVMKTVRLRCMVRGELRYFGYRPVYATYLVESLGDMLLVVRTLEERSLYRTYSFRVYKVNMTNSEVKKVECLDDRVLFLGGNQSLSLSTQDFPALEENSVYFTDDWWSMMHFNYCCHGKNVEDSPSNYGGHDLGVYNLDDIVARPLYQIDADERIIYPPPFWILP